MKTLLAVQHGNMLRHYSRDGRYLGHSIQSNGWATFYDARGRLLGRGKL
jgi:hypothetical protein